MIRALVLLVCVGCTPPKDGETAPSSDRFPDGFLWGTAVAGFQVDGGCPTMAESDCEDPASDWYQWVTDPDLIADPTTHLSGEPLSDGPGWTELYATDIGAASTELHTNAIRMSIEWSRLFPDGAAESATTVDELYNFVDADGLAYTHALIDTARANGLEPLITLNHYTLPLWIHDGKSCHEDLDTCTDRGWVDGDRISRAIALYAGFCGREFGDSVDLWATENEPLAIVLSGYLLPSADRTNPPGVVDPTEAVAVLYNLARGHQAMYSAVKAEDTVDADGDGVASSVGVVTNLAAIAPKDPDSALDQQAAVHADYVYNRAYLNAAVLGEFDADLDGTAEDVEPDLAGRMDFIGINYYTRITVMGLGGPLVAGYPYMDFYPTTLWETYPAGIAEVVDEASVYGLPMIITENGTSATDDTAADTYLRPHLEALKGAIDAGADVRGYFYWTLVDNYEWNHGLEDGYQFGLYALDKETKARTLRPIGEAYAGIVAADGL